MRERDDRGADPNSAKPVAFLRPREPREPGARAIWNDILRAHRARSDQIAAPRRAAIVLGEEGLARALEQARAGGPAWLGLDAVVALAAKPQAVMAAPGSPPDIRVRQLRGGSAIAILSALIELLVEQPDTIILVMAGMSNPPSDGTFLRTVERAFIEIEGKEEGMMVIAREAAIDSKSLAPWLVPSGRGIVRRGAFVPAPGDRAAARRLVMRGAVCDTGIAVVHGRALFELFHRDHALLVRMFVYAAELPAEQRLSYLDAACADLPALRWSPHALSPPVDIEVLTLPASEPTRIRARAELAKLRSGTLEASGAQRAKSKPGGQSG